MRTVSLRVLVATLCALIFAPLAAHAQQNTPAGGPFDDWAGFFIAADYRAHSGADSEVFDNGRRDVAKAFIAAGLKPENIVQFSVRPERYAATPEKPLATHPQIINDKMTEMAKKAPGGCVFFLTSHGSPEAVLVGDYLVRPGALARMIDNACGTKPTVAIVSACFSGIFVPALAGPNRVVLTAARPDRSSFGCGESDVYTFFDTCILEELPQAGAFDVLGRRLRACVEKREREMGMRPASEPQMTVGIAFEQGMKAYALARTYKVQAGDTLAKISQAMYGDDKHADEIFTANRDVIRTRTAAPPAGQTLKIPPV